MMGCASLVGEAIITRNKVAGGTVRNAIRSVRMT